MTKILIVEDDLTFSTMLGTWLRKKGYDVGTASSVGAAVKALLHEETETDLVLSDLRLPDHDGLYLLQWLHGQGRRTPFILMTSYAEVQNAVEAMKMGATDYIAKPVQPDILLAKIREALALPPAAPAPAQPATPAQGPKARPQATTPAPKKAGGWPGTPGTQPRQAQGIEGSSAPARELYRMAALVAPTPMSVLIVGASGTGKEYVAHRIHEQSLRKDGPFVALDCGALTKELAASELFGHVKGAFTGAAADKVGVFEQASGGTLFLDEVGNLTYDVQVQLLRALQERRIRPVGSAEERPVDIRLVCATNENLPEAIARGAYREDLYHRLNEFTLHMPLLRERGSDILEFAHYFLEKANAELRREVEDFTPDARKALLAYPWPGNLREMRNVVVRAALLAGDHPYITATELGLGLAAGQAGVSNPAQGVSNAAQATLPGEPLPQAATARPFGLKMPASQERDSIVAALEQTHGNKSRAAQLLGIDRKTLYNKLKSLNIDP